MQRIKDCGIHHSKCYSLLTLLPPKVGKCSSFFLEPLYAHAAAGRRHLLRGKVFPCPFILFRILSQCCSEARLLVECRSNGADSQDQPSRRLDKSTGHKPQRWCNARKPFWYLWLSKHVVALAGQRILGRVLFLNLYKTMLVSPRATNHVW